MTFEWNQMVEIVGFTFMLGGMWRGFTGINKRLDVLNDKVYDHEGRLKAVEAKVP